MFPVSSTTSTYRFCFFSFSFFEGLSPRVKTFWRKKKTKSNYHFCTGLKMFTRITQCNNRRKEGKKKRVPDLFTTNKLYSRQLFILFLFFFLSGRQPLLYWSEYKRQTAEINSEIGRGTKPIHSEQKWDLNRSPWYWSDEASVVRSPEQRQQQRHTEMSGMCANKMIISRVYWKTSSRRSSKVKYFWVLYCK